MGTLSGQTIQSTYQGLLKLANSSSGITSSYQNVEDGLGNNTGVQIKENFITSPNMWQAIPYKADYYGLGVSSSSMSWSAGQANLVSAELFYDNGMYSYSAITYSLFTSASTGSISIAFYDTQYIDGVGLSPRNLILSGINLTITGATGFKTTTLPSPLSFSATGAGFYFMCLIPSTTAATPTYRFRTSSTFLYSAFLIQSAGYNFNRNNTNAIGPIRNNTTDVTITYSGLTAFPTTFSVADASSYSSTNTIQSIGFILNTIK